MYAVFPPVSVTLTATWVQSVAPSLKVAASTLYNAISAFAWWTTLSFPVVCTAKPKILADLLAPAIYCTALGWPSSSLIHAEIVKLFLIWVCRVVLVSKKSPLPSKATEWEFAYPASLAIYGDNIVDPNPIKINYDKVNYFKMDAEEYCKLRNK